MSFMNLISLVIFVGYLRQSFCHSVGGAFDGTRPVHRAELYPDEGIQLVLVVRVESKAWKMEVLDGLDPFVVDSPFHFAEIHQECSVLGNLPFHAVAAMMGHANFEFL